MHFKFAAALAAVSLATLASAASAQPRHHHQIARETAMHRCNAMVRQHRSMSMANDMHRSAAWKACMHQLGQRP